MSVLVLLGSVFVMAQLDAGTIHGTLEDSTGAVIPQATYECVNENTHNT
jgi:hypothetical protein